MKQEIKILRILVAVLIITNLIICLKSLKLVTEYEALNRENKKLKVLITEEEICKKMK